MNQDSKYSILIFEDDMDLAKQWVFALTKKGMTVYHTTTLNEALEYCKLQEFDAAILDVFIQDEHGNYLPKAGYTLLSYFRNTSLEKIPLWGGTVPILSVTGSRVLMGYDILDYAKAIGANATLRKPFTTEELYTTLLSILKKAPKQT